MIKKSLFISFLFILFTANAFAGSDPDKQLIVYSDDNRIITANTDELRNGYALTGYEKIRTFTVRLYCAPKNESAKAEMLNLATNLINSSDYTYDRFDKITWYCIDGTFNLRNNTFEVNEITFIGDDEYPIYFFHLLKVVNLDDNDRLRESAKSIVNYYESLKANSSSNNNPVIKNQLSDEYTNLINKGANLVKQKNYDEALDCFNKAITLNGEAANAYGWLGNIYYRKKLNDEAIFNYNKAIELDPNNGILYENRGNIYYRKKEYDLAINDYNKSINLDPKRYTAYTSLAVIDYEKKQYDLALQNINKAIDINGNDGSLYMFKGNIYEKMGKEQEAASIYFIGFTHNTTNIPQKDLDYARKYISSHGGSNWGA